MKRMIVYGKNCDSIFYESMGENEGALLEELINILNDEGTRTNLIKSGLESLKIEIKEICPHCNKEYTMKTITEYL